MGGNKNKTKIEMDGMLIESLADSPTTQLVSHLLTLYILGTSNILDVSKI